MVRLRLRRFGNTHRPFYRIAAMDQRNSRNGRVIEEIGTFNPLETDEARQVKLDADRAAYWLSTGAQPSETVKTLLTRLGLVAEPGTPIDKQDMEAVAKAVAAASVAKPKPKPKPAPAPAAAPVPAPAAEEASSATAVAEPPAEAEAEATEAEAPAAEAEADASETAEEPKKEEGSADAS